MKIRIVPNKSAIAVIYRRWILGFQRYSTKNTTDVATKYAIKQMNKLRTRLARMDDWGGVILILSTYGASR